MNIIVKASLLATLAALAACGEQSIDWPAMTMAYTVNGPPLLKGIKAGDRVSFAFSKPGSTYTLTSIGKQ